MISGDQIFEYRNVRLEITTKHQKMESKSGWANFYFVHLAHEKYHKLCLFNI